MIEIKPILTTHPIKKINKIVDDHHQLPEQSQKQEKDDEDKDDNGSNEPEQQHIDEIV